jgi:hypothetical protein
MGDILPGTTLFYFLLFTVEIYLSQHSSCWKLEKSRQLCHSTYACARRVNSIEASQLQSQWLYWGHGNKPRWSTPLHISLKLLRFPLQFTYLRSWALLQKLPIVQPLKNFPTFYGTRRFITVSTRAFHWWLSWARSIQSIPSHPLYDLFYYIPPTYVFFF